MNILRGAYVWRLLTGSKIMKNKGVFLLASAMTMAIWSPVLADQSATVTLAFNTVDYGSKVDATNPATKGTLIHNGEYLSTKSSSRAELQLPSGSITRLGANTSFNYLVDSNTVDLQEGTILFSKPKDGAPRLNIKTAAVTAGIVGTTGFVSVEGKTTVIGLIEGHAGGQRG